MIDLVIPALQIVVLATGLVLAIHTFRKDPRDKITGWGAIVVVMLSASILILEYSKKLPRVITASARNAMVERLKEHSGESVQLAYITDDAEAIAFAQQLEEVLTASGWNVSKGTFPGGVPFRDVYVGLVEEKPTKPVQAFAESLREAGIIFTMGSYVKPPSESEFWIIVSKKRE